MRPSKGKGASLPMAVVEMVETAAIAMLQKWLCKSLVRCNEVGVGRRARAPLLGAGASESVGILDTIAPGVAVVSVKFRIIRCL